MKCKNCNINDLILSKYREVKFCSRYCSNKFYHKIRPSPLKGRKRPDLSKIFKGRPQPHMMGERNHNWKGGVTSLNEKTRKTAQYKEWRQKVFERDKWACVLCKRKRKKGDRVILNADHIKPFALYPELRLDIDNGRTLCQECHRKTDTWGLNQYTKQTCNLKQ